MSKMTRESALEYFKELEEKWLNPTAEYIAHISTKEEIVEHGKYFSEALSILAPEPRTEPPMKYDLADDAKGWGANSADVWVLTTGAVIRSRWGITYTNWLPESALPMPKGGA